MAPSWCYRCQAKAPPSPRKHGWHSISSNAGLVRCCPECAAALGVPPPTQLPPRVMKQELLQKMSRRTLLNKLVKQGYLKREEFMVAFLVDKMVTIGNTNHAIWGPSGNIPYGLTECAVKGFEELKMTDKPGSVYCRMEEDRLRWFVWAYKGNKDLFVPVKVKLDRQGAVIV